MWRKMNLSIRVILMGIAVHLLILAAVFDIYFSSPIDHGMTPFKTGGLAPAKRLVFIVADGLRADTIYEEEPSLTPNLNKIRKERGSWGVSHTRVPTESRPGHVALFGGIYEDPSAILKGWKANPVDFDSVINQSTNAWCWGSPDIVKMFKKEDSQRHIHLDHYKAETQDFGRIDTAFLDEWVFDRLEIFLTQSLNCNNCSELHASGNVFFLHLLGIDTAGHGFKPRSKEYKDNVRVVDKNIPRVEELFDDLFDDHQTAYIFTADHGMTDWGSHGAGSDHETQTPIIAWGAGVKIEDVRKDIQQIDIAPLASSLIGINIPINSIGIIPASYIDTSPKNLNKMILANMRQLLETFNVKMKKRKNNALRFVPFFGITQEAVQERLGYLYKLILSQEQEIFEHHSRIFMKFLIKGADYYHNYYQLPILICITIGLVAWIIYLATFSVPVSAAANRTLPKHVISLGFVTACSAAISSAYVQKLPFSYYVYFLFPVLMVAILVNRFYHILEIMKMVKNSGLRAAFIQLSVYICGLLLLVRSFHDRAALSVLMVAFAGYVFHSTQLRGFTTFKQKSIWISTSFLLAAFPLFPVMQTKLNKVSYLIGYIIWWFGSGRIIHLNYASPFFSYRSLTWQSFIFKCTPIYSIAVFAGIIPVKSAIKYVSLILSTGPVLLIPCTHADVLERVSSIFLAFLPFYLMVSSNFELVFLAVYCFMLFTWLVIESKILTYGDFEEISPDQRRENVYIDDFRRAFIFVIFIFLGFFGTGNIASINSFDPMWVQCFLTVFSPFKMAAIIVMKIVVPFLYTSCIYRCINFYRGGDAVKMFCLVLMFSDIMLLELLYSITNTGSWLAIGMSLSHFIIMVAFALILLVLHFVATFLTNIEYPRVRVFY